MELNSILFPAPCQSYSSNDYPENLIWVPKIPDHSSIPCFLLQSKEGSSKVIIYFHGNAEDLGLSFEILDTLRCVLKVHILAVEYPGYGVYEGKATSDIILNDAECVYSFLLSLGVQPENIIVFGRSIGSGPATFLAKSRKICCLMLMSAYTSIKDAAGFLAGQLGKSLMKERFENYKNMPFITCPTFIVHGVLDKVIPYEQSQKLHELCKGPSSLFLPSRMTHNTFDYCNDLIMPIASFLCQAGIDVCPERDNGMIFVPWDYFLPPPGQRVRKRKVGRSRHQTKTSVELNNNW
jgi:pimeloyl-ACP methyl ester carboxylesterase